MRQRNFSRNKQKRLPKRKIWVFSEGAVSEPLYVRALVKSVKPKGVVIEVQKQHGVPRTLYEAAHDVRKQITKQKRKGSIGQDDEVWIVFDRDEHPRVEETINAAEDNHIEVAFSNPCFEYWLLLHFKDHDAPDDVAGLKRKLAACTDAYCGRKYKILNPDKIVSDVDLAITRATKGHENRKREENVHGNPSTTMFTLVNRIKNAT